MSTQQGALSSFNRPGWLTFAAVVMFAVGVMQAISGIYFLANSTRIADVDGGAFGHHTVALGIWELVIAVLSLAGGYSLLSGRTFGPCDRLPLGEPGCGRELPALPLCAVVRVPGAAARGARDLRALEYVRLE